MPERAFVYLCGSLLFARDHYQRQAAFFSVGKNRTSSLLACAQTDMSAMTQRAFVNFRFRGEIPLDEDQRQTAGMILHNCDTCLVFHKNASQEMIAEKKNMKSLLKEEFGLFKNDNTLGTYQEKEEKF